MSNLWLFISFFIGIFGFLFIFWRNLKEDYTEEKIFTSSLPVVFAASLGLIIGLFVSTKIHNLVLFNSHGLWFWTSFLFASIAFVFLIRKEKLRFYEALDAASLGFVFWISVIYLINIPLLAIGTILLIPVFTFINKNYKTFTWYRSGRVGIAGLLVMCAFFLIRLVVALINPYMLSFVGKIDAVIDVLVAFLFFVLFYKLSDI